MSFFSSIGDAIGNVVKGIGNTITTGVKGVGEVLSGNIGQGLKDIAPAALLGAGVYYAPEIAAAVGGGAAAAAPAAAAPAAEAVAPVAGAATAGLTGEQIATGLTGTGAAVNAPLAGAVAPSITAPTVGALAAGTTLGSLLPSSLASLLPSTPAGWAGLASGAGSVISGLVGANAAQNAAQIQANAAQAASQNQLNMFNTLNAQNAPYRAQGYNALNIIGSGLPGTYTQYDATGKPIGTGQGTGYLTQQFGPAEFLANLDPSYGFRMQQGQQATQRQANLAGGMIGGNALKAMQDYTQGLASTEYGNAFNRFQTQRSNIYNTLASIAGLGQASQQQTNTLGQNLATAQGQLGVGSAAAQAAGQIGQAQALGGAATGASNAVLLSQLLGQNQSVASPTGGSNFMNLYNQIGA